MTVIGVCSWSLRPRDPAHLAETIARCGLNAVQLALEPIRSGAWDCKTTADALRSAGVRIISGMMGMRDEDYSTLESIRRTGGVRLDVHWETNLQAAREHAAIAQDLSLSLVTFHAGFLPHECSNPLRRVLCERLRAVADAFAMRDLSVAFETGQESAETLVGVMRELNDPSIGVDFDPANMILYGMGDPVQALQDLTPWVKQIHIKDALPTKTPGMWGTEVQAGRGAVDWEAFFGVLNDRLPGVDVVIEREAGDARIEDVKAARALIERHARSTSR